MAETRDKPRRHSHDPGAAGRVFSVLGDHAFSLYQCVLQKLKSVIKVLHQAAESTKRATCVAMLIGNTLLLRSKTQKAKAQFLP